MVKDRSTWEFGDFQTPADLATSVSLRLRAMGINPASIVEPTCGRGAFIHAASKIFDAQAIRGVDINASYVDQAIENVESRDKSRVRIEVGDYFAKDWNILLNELASPILIIGNPPWVTNAELGALKSDNLPTKSNFQGHKGLDALTGKANFDISEWMLLQQIEWLMQKPGWLAVLIKTAVARKVLKQLWRSHKPVGRASIFGIDAMQHFGASVDACLFVLPVRVVGGSSECDVYDNLESDSPSSTIGWQDGNLISDVSAYSSFRNLIGVDTDRVWRSGVKHDCSKVMELKTDSSGGLVNGFGNTVDIEPEYLFPMLKSSDVSKGAFNGNRFMIVPQKKVGDDTAQIEKIAPRTWAYLLSHAEYLDGRGSVIYKGKPRFSVFGIGDYSFSPWKVAISGFYKSLNFSKFGPFGGKPSVFDDTVYSLECTCEQDASHILMLVNSEPFRCLLSSMIFLEEKRPVTTDLLRRISLSKVADYLGLSDQHQIYSERLSLAKRS